jgi:hypothetical protein
VDELRAALMQSSTTNLHAPLYLDEQVLHHTQVSWSEREDEAGLSWSCMAVEREDEAGLSWSCMAVCEPAV